MVETFQQTIKMWVTKGIAYQHNEITCEEINGHPLIIYSIGHIIEGVVFGLSCRNKRVEVIAERSLCDYQATLIEQTIPTFLFGLTYIGNIYHIFFVIEHETQVTMRIIDHFVCFKETPYIQLHITVTSFITETIIIFVNCID